MNWVRANLWRAVAVVLAVLVVRLLIEIHGLPIIGGGLNPALSTCEGNLAAIDRAQAEAEALQAAVNEDEERRTAANAERSDAFHAQDLERSAAAGRTYADRNRIAGGGVRAQSDRGAPSQAPAAASGSSAGIYEELPADYFVAVSAADVQACTAAVTWAVGAFNWAQTLNENQAPPDGAATNPQIE